VGGAAIVAAVCTQAWGRDETRQTKPNKKMARGFEGVGRDPFPTNSVFFCTKSVL
jgi:hypothetical protein